jgi:hypothetical protein
MIYPTLLPNSQGSTIWLANLIHAMQEVESLATPSDPSVTNALCQRLRLPGLLPAQATLH